MRRPGPFATIFAAIFATVAALLPVAVAAQTATLDNLTEIVQDGADNVATITQGGASNTAGTTSQPMRQDGFFNRLVIDQTGDANLIGDDGLAVLQTNTTASIDGTNIATLTQSGDRNRVGEVQQVILGPVPAFGNSLSVTQAEGDGNVIGVVSQRQDGGLPGQQAQIVMRGFGNRIDLVEQQALSDLRNEENAIRAVIDGSNNGTTALRGVSQLPLVQVSALRQIGGNEDTGSNGNLMELQIFGDDTAFGISQRGRANRTGAIVITGDGNAIGVDQDGSENDLSVGLIEGDDNEIGMSQYGTNVALLVIVGNSDRNEVLIDQMGTNDSEGRVEGDLNLVSVTQRFDGGLGGTSTADFTVLGDANLADVLQEGDNAITLRIEGNSNNYIGGGFTAAATPSGLLPGAMTQVGFGNVIAAEILGDRNLAAFLQQGLDNTIGLRTEGSDNEAVLRQIGNGNIGEVGQQGRGNRAVILQ